MKRLVLPLAMSLTLAGCAIPFIGSKDIRTGGVYKDNFDPDRVVDLIITKKLTGKKKLMFFSESALYLEGYIRGVVVDYDDTPLEGIIVRVMDHAKDMAGFDPAVSDANGVYKIRFSLPIKKNIVDMKGTIAYNPPWQQQLDILDATLEPQTKASNFRLYYNKKTGIIAIGEDAPKTISRKVTKAEKQASQAQEKGKKQPERKPAPPPPARATGSEDPFGGFGDFGN